ncbi:MAG TPA: DUF3822 family protein [Bacteroidales bacterium]
MQESGNNYQPSPHTLSIRSKPDGFSFCYSGARGSILKELKIPTIFDFQERFEDFVQSRGWAEKENMEVTLIDFSNHFMILPENNTNEEHIKTFFNFQFQHSEASQIFTVPMCDGNQLFCWEMPSSRDKYFERLFPHLTTYSSAYLLANWTIQQADTIQQPVMVAHLYGNAMHIFAANTQKLLFANTFKIKDLQEIPYYLLRCLDQLSLDPLQTRCTFCCESVSEQDILDLFTPYIKHLEMATFTHQTDKPLEIIEKNKTIHANR